MKIYNYIAWGLGLSFFSGHTSAIEFNTEFLKIGDNTQVDLSQLSQPDRVPAGQYLVDIMINKNYLRQEQIDFITPDTTTSAEPCLSRELIHYFGLKTDYLKQLPQGGDCLVPQQLPDISVRYSKTLGQLVIVIPQILLEYQDENYVPPAQWSHGIAGMLLDYRLIANTRQNRQQKRVNALSGYGTIGVNAGAWRLRTDYQYHRYSDRSDNKSIQFNQIHAFRPLPELKAQLTLGETYLSSNIFDTLSYTGINFASDERMLPPSLRGYAPRITGIAKTNAKVTITQQGRTVYVTTVPPGPFSIEDLSSAVQGELQVEVEEEDGSTSQFPVNTASVPFLTRQGQIRFSTAVGKPNISGSHSLQQPAFTLAEASYGLSSTWSLYGGSILANHYMAHALGVGKDLSQFGALSADVTQSRATLDNQSLVGHSWRLNYAKRFSELNTDIRFFGYRFSDRNFVSLNKFTNSNNGRPQYDSKQRYSAVAAKQFEHFSTYLSYTHDAYWNAKSTQRLDLSTSTLFDLDKLRNIQLTLSLSYSQEQRYNETLGYLGFSIPLEQQRRVNYNLQTGRGRADQTMSLRQTLANGDDYQLTVGGQQNKPLISSTYQHDTDRYQLGLSGSYVADRYHAASATLSGSLVSTAQGSALHAAGSGGNTRLLVSSNGVEDIYFNNGKTRTNQLGYAVIDGTPPYGTFDARLDVNRLPDNAEPRLPIRRTVLTEGAIGFLPFDVSIGSKVLARLTTESGDFAPFGAEVSDEQTGRNVAIVGEEGLTYLTGIQPQSRLVVRWEDELCLLQLPQQLPDLTSPPQQILCRSLNYNQELLP